MPKTLLPLLLLVATACIQQKPVGYLAPAGPFELYVVGHTEQAVWGPLEKYATATVYCQGRPLAMRGVADTLYPRFDWWLPLPQGRLLLGYRNLADTLADPFAQHLYLLDTANGRPHLQGLGFCPLSIVTPYPRRPLGQQAPSIRLTPDSAGLLLTATDPIPLTTSNIHLAADPTYHFFDLRRPATYTPLPRPPVRSDSLPLEPWYVGWSPDHRQLAVGYDPQDGHYGAGLAVSYDRRTGRQHRRYLPHTSDTLHSQAAYDQLRWVKAGETYRLARK